jgi:hypothetical protein
MIKFACCVLLLLLVSSSAAAQEFPFSGAAVGNEAMPDKAMPELASKVIAAYQESDRDKYLDTLFRLQLAAGRYADARASLAALRELRTKTDPARLAT